MAHIKKLSSLFLIILISGCSSLSVISEEQSKKNFSTVYQWAQSQKLLEPFPFVNPFTLEKPTQQEKTGIQLDTPSVEQFDVSGKQIFKQVIGTINDKGFLSKLFVDQNGTFSFKIRNDSPSYKGLVYKSGFSGNADDPDNKSRSFAFTGNTDMKGKIAFGKDPELKADQFSSSIKYSGGTALKEINYIGADNYIMKDIDTDKMAGFYEFNNFYMSFPILPIGKVKAGDQWEKQIYFTTSVTVKDTANNTSTGKGYIFQLYTFELAGFANVGSKRCAIIEYVMEHYGMGYADTKNIQSKEDIKKYAKTLSKSSMKEIRSFMSDKVPESVYKTAGASQLGQKYYGIFALDYSSGMIIEMHTGGQEIMGTGVSGANTSVSIQQVVKTQVIYKANIR